VSETNPLRAAVVGGGSFGTCLAIVLAERGHDVLIWTRNEAVADGINRHHRNPRYLTEFRLPEGIRATASLEQALSGREVVLSVLPSHAVREVWAKAGSFADPDAMIVSASKGIEVGTGKLVSQVLEEVLPPALAERLVVISGPSFAREIAERRPTALTVASKHEALAIAVQSLISSPLLRCYSNPDVVGVELGGALKNVIAIAVGIVDGLDLGLNARAAVITRGLAEINRLGAKLGANPLTFLGLSGIGDLVLTCTGELSRNRQVGVAIGHGKRLDDVLAGLHQVAEGVRTARSAHELARLHDVDMPITEEVYRVLYEGKDFRNAIRELLGRQLRSEHE
jgi:glycerol-3-phosphate dehydrogenase (NAD(P)+)